MLKNLTTEARNSASETIDTLSPLEIVRLMNAEDAKVAPAVGQQAEQIATAVEQIAERLQQGGRLIYIGAGTSGRLGVLDATECPPTFNSPPGQVIGLIAGGTEALTRAIEGAEDRPELAAEDLRGVQLSAQDCVVGIATSGRTPYVVGGLQYARQVGAFTVALACNATSSIAEAAELTIAPIVGPEVLSGSTRLKAGTATKLVLNMLTTGAMVRIGKTYGNLMVDLRATNTKLRDRARRIVAALTGLDEEQAQPLLDRAGGELKSAVVLHRLESENHPEATVEKARQLLAEAGGQLRGALACCAPQQPSPSSRVANQRLILGIDGGGTSTAALLARVEAGRPVILGRGEAGPANPQVIGFTAACQTIETAVRQAFAQAEIEPGTVAAAVLALAGAGRPSDRTQLEACAQSARLAERFEQVNDALPLLACGTPDGWGIALIAGTGSLCFGRDAAGQTARAGGWGHLLGDEGSAYRLAVDALRAVALAADGRGPKTLLTERILEELKLSEPSQLITAIHGRPLGRAALAGLAPLVTSAADDGDRVALRVVEQGADELASLMEAVARQLGLTSMAFPMALAGGVLTSSALMREQLDESLRRRKLTGEPVQIVTDPVEGTLQLACELAARR